MIAIVAIVLAAILGPFAYKAFDDLRNPGKSSVVGTYSAPPLVLQAMNDRMKTTRLPGDHAGQELIMKATNEMMTTMSLRLDANAKATLTMCGVGFEGVYETTPTRIVVTFEQIRAPSDQLRKKIEEKYPGIPAAIFEEPMVETTTYARSTNPNWLFLRPEREGLVDEDRGATPIGIDIASFYLSR